MELSLAGASRVDDGLRKKVRGNRFPDGTGSASPTSWIVTLRRAAALFHPYPHPTGSGWDLFIGAPLRPYKGLCRLVRR